MALCVSVVNNVLQVSSTETELTCTSYLLVTADEYRVHSGFFSGVDLQDVIEVSWLVVLVWAIAWAFKPARRAF